MLCYGCIDAVGSSENSLKGHSELWKDTQINNVMVYCCILIKLMLPYNMYYMYRILRDFFRNTIRMVVGWGEGKFSEIKHYGYAIDLFEELKICMVCICCMGVT